MGLPVREQVRGSVDAEIQSPGGWRASMKGADTASLVICALIIICTCIVLWQLIEADKRRETDKEVFIDLHKTTQRLLGKMDTSQMLTIEVVKDTMQRNEDSAAGIVFMLGLNQQQREEMKLTMPASLRKQMNNR